MSLSGPALFLSSKELVRLSSWFVLNSLNIWCLLRNGRGFLHIDCVHLCFFCKYFRGSKGGRAPMRVGYGWKEWFLPSPAVSQWEGNTEI